MDSGLTVGFNNMDLTGDHDERSEKMIGGDSEETNWRQHVLTMYISKFCLKGSREIRAEARREINVKLRGKCCHV